MSLRHVPTAALLCTSDTGGYVCGFPHLIRIAQSHYRTWRLGFFLMPVLHTYGAGSVSE